MAPSINSTLIVGEADLSVNVMHYNLLLAAEKPLLIFFPTRSEFLSFFFLSFTVISTIWNSVCHRAGPWYLLNEVFFSPLPLLTIFHEHHQIPSILKLPIISMFTDDRTPLLSVSAPVPSTTSVVWSPIIMEYPSRSSYRTRNHSYQHFKWINKYKYKYSHIYLHTLALFLFCCLSDQLQIRKIKVLSSLISSSVIQVSNLYYSPSL